MSFKKYGKNGETTLIANLFCNGAKYNVAMFKNIKQRKEKNHH